MATTVRKHKILSNPGKRRFSAKQIRAGFGGKRRKAALKSKHRPRTKPNRAKKAHKQSHRNAARPRAPKRENPGELLSITLPNPASGRRNMAHTATKTNKKHHHHKKHNKARRNPGMYAKKNKHTHHRRRHNPPGGSVVELFTQGLFATAGLVLSRLGTQMALGASNVGFMGYAGNAAATAVLAFLTHMVSKNPKNRNAVVLGGAMGIIARLVTDYTPYGQLLQAQGLGDYGMGVYLESNQSQPYRLTSPAGAMVYQPAQYPAPMPAAAKGMAQYRQNLYA